MNAFEFAFSLFGLLLGLSLVEVLAGLVRTSKARRKVRIGWLTPMLGVVVMLHLTTFWVDAWRLRDLIPVTNGTLFVGLLITSIYYYAASHVFPEDPEDCIDLDDYFAKFKGNVLGGVVLCQLISSTAARILRDAPWHLSSVLLLAGFLVFLGAPAIIKSRLANTVILSLIILLFILVGVADTV